MTFNVIVNLNLFTKFMKEGFPKMSDVKGFPSDAKLIDVLFDRETGDADLVFETNAKTPETLQISVSRKGGEIELSLVPIHLPTHHQSKSAERGCSNFPDFLRKVTERCIHLFEERQTTHGDAWKSLDLIDLASMIFVKAMREKEASRSQKDRTVQEEHLYDLINYAMMGLYRLREEQK